MRYDAQFFDDQKPAVNSAAVVLPMVVEWLGIQSVVDVGCGIGSWASIALGLGISDVLGVDGDYVDRDRLTIRSRLFHPTNLEQRFQLGRRFDLAICLEVAEHLSPQRAPSFVADLCSLADAILFSAAIPWQGGVHHVNEQWPSYWAALFDERGFECFDTVRPRIWGDDRVAHIYRQNCFLAATGTHAQALREITPCPLLDLVHPATWASLQHRPGCRAWLKMAPAAIANSLAYRRHRE